MLMEKKDFNQLITSSIYSLLTNGTTVKTVTNKICDKVKRLSASFSNIDKKDLYTCLLINSLNRFFEERGGYYGWSYKDISYLKNGLLSLLLSIEESTSGLSDLSKRFTAICSVDKQPFMCCHLNCASSVCLFKFEGEKLILSGQFSSRFKEASNSEGIEGRKLWKNLIIDSGREVVFEGENKSHNKLTIQIGICYIIQESEKAGIPLAARNYLVREAVKAVKCSERD